MRGHKNKLGNFKMRKVKVSGKEKFKAGKLRVEAAE